MRPFSRSVVPRVLLVALLELRCGEASLANAPQQDVAAVQDDATARVRALRAEISRHDDLYYRRAQPEISDAEYDLLKEELAGLERSLLREADGSADPAVVGIGDDRIPGFRKHRHRDPMLSLAKTTCDAGLAAFEQRVRTQLGAEAGIRFVVEPKFDGVAISATYTNGELVTLATRGNGFEGDDVTAMARLIDGLPVKLVAGPGRPIPRFLEARGEVYLSFAEFDRINRSREDEGRAPFASPRNLAAGTLKAFDDDDALDRRRLDVVFFGVGAIEADGAPTTQKELLQWLQDLGLPSVGNACYADTLTGIREAVQRFGEARETLPYPIDGAVVKLDSVVDRARLGSAPDAPKWAIAFKYPPGRTGTRIRAITLQIGRTGVATPVAELEPVKLAGATIARATLHNADEISRRDIRIGDYVFVARQGEIIPAVVGVDLARRPSGSVAYSFPLDCPSCRARLVRRPAEVAWRCENRTCAGRLRGRVAHFASELRIRGLGEATVQSLIEQGLLREIPDLFRLRTEDLVIRLSMGARSSAALLASIEQAKAPPLWRLISGLGIPGIGRAGARKLAQASGGLDRLARMTDAEFRHAGLGDDVAEKVAVFFSADSNRGLVAELVAVGVRPRPED